MEDSIKKLRGLRVLVPKWGDKKFLDIRRETVNEMLEGLLQKAVNP